MDLASVSWGTRRAIHFRGKMWMARQFTMSGLIAVGAISLGFIGSQLNSWSLVFGHTRKYTRLYPIPPELIWCDSPRKADVNHLPVFSQASRIFIWSGEGFGRSTIL